MTDAIDLVIPWVDGDDPVHRAERNKFTTGTDAGNLEDVGGDSRFSSIGEIFYCILSINVFAPFVRKIYIVTDRQDPHLDKPLAEALPEGHIPMEIIDHKVIFRGYEEYLPTFNSRAIETLIWRIPGLSERFLLMNDDFMFIGKVSPEDFFQDGKTICYAKMFPTWWARFMRMLRPERKGHKRISFKDSMLNAVDIIMNRITVERHGAQVDAQRSAIVRFEDDALCAPFLFAAGQQIGLRQLLSRKFAAEDEIAG